MPLQIIHIDKTLLALIATGDTPAFRELYERYRKKVYFLAWHLLKTEDEAEDICQEIFTKLWVNRQKLPEIDNFNAYLNTLIRNHVYNCLRRKACEESFVTETLQSDVEHLPGGVMDPAELRELQLTLKEAIWHLPPQQKRVFELSRIEGYKHDEIAKELHISRETVKKHIMAAIRNIREFLRREGKEVLYFICWLMLC
ncbi:MAG TPA: RNA polymerase sigma-70 factor [Puia sp.]|nr:RNA polymerase sigma-70 factor [Puia sp.]